MRWYYLDNQIKNNNNIWNYTGMDYKEYNFISPELNDFDQDDDVRSFILYLLMPYEQKQNYYNTINSLPLISYITETNLNINISTVTKLDA